MRGLLTVLQSGEIWGAFRVLLDNVWSVDVASRHRYKPLCAIVKVGFATLGARNAICDWIGDDGRRPDLR